MNKKRKLCYEVWYDLETFDRRLLIDESTPGLKKKDAKELAKKYRTHPECKSYQNVRIVKVRRTIPKWINR